MKAGDQRAEIRGRVSETRFSLLEQEVGTIKSDINELRSEIRGYFSRSSWRSVWPIVITAGTVLWFVLNLQITSSNKNTDDKANRGLEQSDRNTTAISKMLEVQQTVVQQNATSLQDRKDQRDLIGKITDLAVKQGELQARMESRMEAGFAEVETQIDSMAQSTNMALAELFRRQSDHQNAMADAGLKMPHTTHYPTVLPNVSNREGSKRRSGQ